MLTRAMEISWFPNFSDSGKRLYGICQLNQELPGEFSNTSIEYQLTGSALSEAASRFIPSSCETTGVYPKSLRAREMSK